MFDLLESICKCQIWFSRFQENNNRCFFYCKQQMCHNMSSIALLKHHVNSHVSYTFSHLSTSSCAQMSVVMFVHALMSECVCVCACAQCAVISGHLVPSFCLPQSSSQLLRACLSPPTCLPLTLSFTGIEALVARIKVTEELDLYFGFIMS